MLRQRKNEIIAEVKEVFPDIQSIVLADYRGLDVPTVTEVRDEFRAAGCHYRVLKNTLVRIALQDTEAAGMAEHLKGPTVVIWSTESPSAAAKAATEVAKKHGKFIVKAGYFDGQVLDEAGVKNLATMPGKDELRATLLMTFIAAPTDFVRQVVAGPQNFMYLLSARERALGEG